MFPIFVTIMLIGMIWSGFGYSGGALLFAIMLVIGGWAVLIFWAGGKSPDADPKQTQPSPNSAKSASPASSSRPGASSNPASSAGAGASGYAASSGAVRTGTVRTGAKASFGADDTWDNSDEAGGLPRDISPFSDIDDAYDRMALEDEMFLEDFEILSGGNPYDGDSFGGFGDGGFGDGFGDGGWFGDDD